MSGLETRNLTVSLGGRVVLDDVSLNVAGGCLTGLIGPNGAGKSTLSRALAGLLPGRGRVLLDGAPIERTSRLERARKVAYLPQERDVHWPLTVRELVALGRLPWGDGRSPADREAVARAMRLADLEALAERRATELSGGERARALLARALATETPILLADEPVAALDPEHQLRVMELLRRHAEAGAAVVVVMHDLFAAARFCGRAILLDQGRVIADGEPDEVLDPENLRRRYHIEAIYPERDGRRFPVPWRALAED